MKWIFSGSDGGGEVDWWVGGGGGGGRGSWVGDVLVSEIEVVDGTGDCFLYCCGRGGICGRISGDICVVGGERDFETRPPIAKSRARAIGGSSKAQLVSGLRPLFKSAKMFVVSVGGSSSMGRIVADSGQYAELILHISSTPFKFAGYDTGEIVKFDSESGS